MARPLAALAVAVAVALALATLAGASALQLPAPGARRSAVGELRQLATRCARASGRPAARAPTPLCAGGDAACGVNV